MIYGWVEKSDKTTDEILFDFNNSNIRGFIFTDVSRDGMLTGIDIEKIDLCIPDAYEESTNDNKISWRLNTETGWRAGVHT